MVNELIRPVRAKALIINAFALTRRMTFIGTIPQGDALGYELLPLGFPFGRRPLRRSGRYRVIADNHLSEINRSNNTATTIR